MNPSASTAATEDGEFPSLRRLLVGHKPVAFGVAAVIAVLLAIVLLAVFGAKAGVVSDSTSCTQWGSANQVRQAAYAKLYIKEHGPLQGGGASPTSVITAINDGCARAYGDDVSDSVTVVQAISGKF